MMRERGRCASLSLFVFKLNLMEWGSDSPLGSKRLYVVAMLAVDIVDGRHWKGWRKIMSYVVWIWYAFLLLDSTMVFGAQYPWLPVVVLIGIMIHFRLGTIIELMQQK